MTQTRIRSSVAIDGRRGEKNGPLVAKISGDRRKNCRARSLGRLVIGV